MHKNNQSYLLCENPIEKDDFKQYIYSAGKGKRALISIIPVEVSDLFNSDKNKQSYSLCFFSKETGYPEFYLFEISDNWDLSENSISDVLTGAGKWFKIYLLWTENQSYKGITKEPILKNYNNAIKGLKLIYSKNDDKYVSIYKGKIDTYNSEIEMDQWLIDGLNLPEEIVENGIINEL